MKHRIHRLLVGAMGLASAAFFVFAGASCDQPTIQCVAGHGPFFAEYKFVSGDEACLRDRLGYTGPALGEDIGLSTYLAPNEDKTLADYDNRSIAVQSSLLGALFRQRFNKKEAGTMNPALDEADKPYSFGTYSTAPDANNLCFAGNATTGQLTQAEINVPDTDDMSGGMPVVRPATHYRQQWKDLKVFVTAGVPGTQAVGKMSFEDVTNGCSAEYSFVGLFPSVYCGKDVDQDGNPETEDDIITVPDEEACLPEADPAKGRVYGSGINPDFTTRCHPELFHCVLTSAPLTGAP